MKICTHTVIKTTVIVGDTVIGTCEACKKSVTRVLNGELPAIQSVGGKVRGANPLCDYPSGTVIL